MSLRRDSSSARCRLSALDGPLSTFRLRLDKTPLKIDILDNRLHSQYLSHLGQGSQGIDYPLFVRRQSKFWRITENLPPARFTIKIHRFAYCFLQISTLKVQRDAKWISFNKANSINSARKSECLTNGVKHVVGAGLTFMNRWHNRESREFMAQFYQSLVGLIIHRISSLTILCIWANGLEGVDCNQRGRLHHSLRSSSPP